MTRTVLNQKPPIGAKSRHRRSSWKKSSVSPWSRKKKPQVKVRCTSDKTLPGQYYDEETNLHYNRFRYYDPSIGRYITSDPIFKSHFILNNLLPIGEFGTNQNISPIYMFIDAPENLHLYNYSLNNPIRYIDQYGLYCGGGPLGNIPILDYIWGINFSQPCSNHDSCYEICDIGKGNCDNKFLENMLSTCTGRNIVNKILCLIKATAFYTAVRKHGKPFYDEAQKDCKGGDC